ncbi:hypothetical protein [Halomonas daqiaonensis]|uniref:hypothetical protein n=1 Tax=Halomonas daqiaonensis TaxID=650850 RepID=UPI0011137AF0|nr:hypothetical protein [Halomonas daqiaonensis]
MIISFAFISYQHSRCQDFASIQSFSSLFEKTNLPDAKFLSGGEEMTLGCQAKLLEHCGPGGSSPGLFLGYHVVIPATVATQLAL